MIVTVCPSHSSYDESTFALKFATRVRRINLGTAHRNIAAKNLEETIKNLNSQISLLSKSKERSDSQLLTLKREKERIQEKLEKAATARTNSKEEMKTLAVLRNSNHDITSRWQKEKAIREEKTMELEKAQEQVSLLFSSNIQQIFISDIHVTTGHSFDAYKKISQRLNEITNHLRKRWKIRKIRSLNSRRIFAQ